MSFVWTKYLELADDLCAQSSCESADEHKLRCAISRAYYSAFHAARNLLRIEDPNLPVKYGHTNVYSDFLYDADPNRQKIGQTLKELKERRESADYDGIYAFGNLLSGASYLIVTAEDIVDDIGNLTPRPQTPQNQ